MTTRRRFIQIVLFAAPLTGAALLAACSDKAVPPAPAAATPATPAPAAAPEVPATPATPVAAGAMVDEKDAMAVALGYSADATKVDKTKHATYAAGQACAACALYQGAAGSASGPCPLYAGKQVSAKGWCISFAKKAA